MRSRLLPLALFLAALVPARAASADDGASIRRLPYAPIAGTPIPSSIDLSPKQAAKYPGLVIAGAVVGGLGMAGAITGLLLTSSDANVCRADVACPATRREIGTTTLMASAGVAAAGLVMVLVGIQPANEPAASASLVPSVAIGPTGGALTWRF